MSGLVVVVVLALSAAAPAFAKPKTPTHYTAKLNCGAGMVIVDTGADIFAPLVQRETGRVYYPVAFRVKAHGVLHKPTLHYHGRTVKCSYNDGTARGTVWVKAPKHLSHRKH
jgi:hypothetical protein